MASPTDVKAQLQAIRQSYCASLPEKLARIEFLWQQWQNDPTSKADYEELYRLLHSIAGSAETFGLPELTGLARTILQQLKGNAVPMDVSRNLSELSRLIQDATRT